jgi:hypothetical protein
MGMLRGGDTLSYGRNISDHVFHDKVERVGETGKSRCIRKRKGHHRKKANCLGLGQKRNMQYIL